jgi:putative ATPase
MPEGRIILGQVTALLASSPKSNRSYVAINQALADLKKKGPGQVPIHLRNAVSPLMKDLGYGKAYHYPHDDNRYLEDDYLPDEYRGAKYYEPSSAGTEAQLKEHLKRLRPNKD